MKPETQNIIDTMHDNHYGGDIETLRPDFIVPMHNSIAGIGLTTLRALNMDDIIGVSHIEDSRFADGWARTFIGSLVNHEPDEDATCRYMVQGVEGRRILYLATQQICYPGQELTVEYGNVKELNKKEG